MQSQSKKRKVVKNNPKLFKDIWRKIITEHELDVKSILRLCKVNKYFHQFCADKLVWDRLFVNEFGQEALEKATRVMPDHPLERFWAARLANEEEIETIEFDNGWMFEIADEDDYPVEDFGIVYFISTGWSMQDPALSVFTGYGLSREPRYEEEDLIVWEGSVDSLEELREPYTLFIYHCLIKGIMPKDKEPLLRDQCLACEAPNATQICSGCREARYCDEDCQHKDWFIHQINC